MTWATNKSIKAISRALNKISVCALRNPGRQVVEIEGFHHIIIRAAPQTIDTHMDLAHGAQNQHQNMMPPLPQHLTDAQAVQLWQQNIKEDDTGYLSLQAVTAEGSGGRQSRTPGFLLAA